MGFLSYLSKTYHRNLLEKLLNKYKYLIKGNILDIGSKNRRYDHLFKGNITAIDIRSKPEYNILKGDLTHLEFESNNFDSIICLEVFEYIEPDKFKQGYEEIYRVLKPNGRVIISIPFYYKDHEDFMRVTYDYILNYLIQLNQFKIKIIKFGNKYTALYDVIRYTKLERKSNILRNFCYNSVLLILYLVIKLFTLEKKQDFFYSGCFIILSKTPS